MTFVAYDERMQAVLDEFAGVLRGIDILRQVYTYIPDNLGSLPVGVIYPFTGTWSVNTTEDIVGLHDIVAELHFLPKTMRVSSTQSTPLGVIVPYLLFKGIRDQTYTQIDTIANIIYEYGVLGYEDMSNKTIGWRFTLTGVKTRVAYA